MGDLILTAQGSSGSGQSQQGGGDIAGTIARLGAAVLEQALLGSDHARQRAGPQLDTLRIPAAREGTPVPRLWGAMRVGGQVIWAARFREKTKDKSTGGKGGGPRVTTSKYFASFALALCDGPIDGIGRLWADGEEWAAEDVTIRLYHGTEDQTPDPLIAEVEGAAPAFRGTAYLVFEDMPLKDFGNRVPRINVEVFRRPPAEAPALPDLIRAMDLIPSSGEFAYATEPVLRKTGEGAGLYENVNGAGGRPDLLVSLDQLQDQAPNAGAVALVVAWFGTDLRAGECRVEPRVEVADKKTKGQEWIVSGLTRADVNVVSQSGGAPVYGGTPSDESILQTIAELKARGLRVLFYPFILMDIPPESGLPNPYDPASEQPVFPWRGRITCHPAPGVSGSPDKSAAAATQISAFLGTAGPSDFSPAGKTIEYQGTEVSLRRMVLHYAHLCAKAGGVDAFCIASELRGLTQVRSAAGTYPFVDGLVDLLHDVRSVLGSGTKLSYAADWSEYFGHHPGDGSGDVFFHLDPLWSDPQTDFIGIDAYFPLADWRDGVDHLDAAPGRTIYDTDYLQSNIEGGEGYDWFYAGEAARRSQTRTPIGDSAYTEDWVFRPKDLRAWWASPHYNRPGGVRAASPTAWVPESKPIWFTELGCPAVDKGPNQPNVFYDPKSSESFFPYFSNGGRDDLAQRRYLEAMLRYWDGPANPASALYGGRMLDTDNLYIWTWDARPFPAFPARREVWGDWANWQLGHWISGRLSAAPLSDLVRALCREGGVEAVDAALLNALVPGLMIEQTEPPRRALEALMLAYAFDALERPDSVRFLPRSARLGTVTAGSESLALEEPGDPLFRRTRSDPHILPDTVRLSYIEAGGDYAEAESTARMEAETADTPAGGLGTRVAGRALPLALHRDEAEAMARTRLLDLHVMRERVTCALPRSAIGVEVGDVLALPDGRTARIESVTDGSVRRVEALYTDQSLYDPVARAASPPSLPRPAPPTLPLPVLLDVPSLDGLGEAEPAGPGPLTAVHAVPWPGEIALLRADGTSTEDPSGFTLDRTLTQEASLGETLDPLPAAPPGRLQRGQSLRIRLYAGTLASLSLGQMLSGGNALALETAPGRWEILQCLSAELTGVQTYTVSGLLRGQAGSEDALTAQVPAGARIVHLDEAVAATGFALGDLTRSFALRFVPAGVSLNDPQTEGLDVTVTGRALRPHAPVHLRARRTGGDWALSWIRRTRIGGDLWDGGDVPLGEAREAYRTEILDGAGAAVRTIDTAGPSLVYTGAQQTADFGAPLTAPPSWRVAQLSDTVGAGVWAACC